jgi:hypothetical protein
MAQPEIISLRTGAGRWLRSACALVSMLGAVSILLAQANPLWTGAALAVLCLISVAAFRRIRRNGAGQVLTLHGDDSATLLTARGAVPMLRRGGDWASRWCCVLRLQQVLSGHRCDCLVCRSLNSPDAYRRLLVSLRMREVRNRDNMRWS